MVHMRNKGKFTNFISLTLRDFPFMVISTFLYMFICALVVSVFLAENGMLTFLDLLISVCLFAISFVAADHTSSFTERIRLSIRRGLTARFKEESGDFMIIVDIYSNDSSSFIVETEAPFSPGEVKVSSKDVENLLVGKFFVRIEIDNDAGSIILLIPKLLVKDLDKMNKQMIASKI